MPFQKPIFTWDEPKRLANIDHHNLDFVHAKAGDWNHALVHETYPGRRGEPRFKAIVQLRSRLIVVIFSPLGTEALSTSACVRRMRRRSACMPRSKVKPYTEDDVADVLDSPEWTEDDFARARPFPEVFPEIANRLRGARPEKPAKKLVSLKLDADVIERFRSGGRNWQARINEVLRKAVGL
jgi:uncharacterized protein (DUF4415 family)/uncharacterized DUF497 family protein